MSTTEMIAQIFGLMGLFLNACSFQTKDNKKLALLQGLGGLMFFVNFILIGAVAAALFNITCLVRGLLFAKNNHKIWKLITTEVLFMVCFVFSAAFAWGDVLQIVLASMTFFALVGATVFMWHGNGKYIRYFQLFYASPAWIIHNVFNFTLGGIICETLNIISVIVSFIRYGKEGFEKL